MRKQFFLFKEEEIDLQEPNENFESTKTHLTGCKASEKFLEERITRIQTVPIKQHTPKLKKKTTLHSILVAIVLQGRCAGSN